ncbi:M48 family metallopeptidase [Ottowia sp.]|uniref:M48 family metallopeptidase n=1 Tax=Ottowia sp. TaxID=1898956 RepID=UPI002B99FE98|nr:M48 family metallopeptidase [Ottowia sp.]HOB66916.1 M48 family metallopeptidase [Ottowia sp.]HPZ57900.1 M48 family metallopeptidase [Ottowia sp.]HQD46853.1 M48 family metallopeptidase [Ottowia sp.]
MTATPSPALLTSLVFALALLASLALKYWLASRQTRAVARHRSAVPAEFAASIDLAIHQRAADYTIARLRVGLLELALAGVVLLLWTLLGGLDALNGVLMNLVGPRPLLQPLALLVAFTVINALIDLPLSLYQTFVIEQRFGFNKMTFRLWLADLLKSTLVGVVIGVPLAAGVLWLMQATGEWWWLWTWGAWAAFSLLMLVIYPTVIAPLFNQFQPLQDESLKDRVTQLMARCGFAAKGLFVMDGSRRSAHANAYFTGFGAAKRVVFFDTLLNQLTPPEVEAVLAHELGHFKHKHIVKRIAGMFAASLIGLALLGWLAQQPWFYAGLGVTPNLPPAMGGAVPNHALALLLFMLAVPLFTFFLSPLMAQLSRKHEFEADAYAATQANAQDLSNALVKLYKDNASTLTPDALYVRFYYSHPPARERIARMGARVQPV